MCAYFFDKCLGMCFILCCFSAAVFATTSMMLAAVLMSVTVTVVSRRRVSSCSMRASIASCFCWLCESRLIWCCLCHLCRLCHLLWCLWSLVASVVFACLDISVCPFQSLGCYPVIVLAPFSIWSILAIVCEVRFSELDLLPGCVV